MEEFFLRVWNDLEARVTGPLSLRLFLQPTMATIFASRDGVKDAKNNRRPYFYALFTDAKQRGWLLSEGWHAVAKVFVLAIILDALFQLIVFKWIYPGEILLVAFLLALNPYLLVRGLVNRIARSFGSKSAQKLCVYIVGALCLLPAAVQLANGQTQSQPVVFIRNVRIADTGPTTVVTDVLVVGGKVTRVHGTEPPAGALVIDGAGNVLTLNDAGEIKLTPDLAAKTTTDNQLAHVSTPPPVVNQSAQHVDDNLAAQVVDPTAALKTITFQSRFSPSLWGVDDEQNEVDMQLGIPHSAFQHRNILRVTIPYATSAPDGRRGLTDVSVFNILLFPKKWATIAAGGVASVGTHKGAGIDTFAVGPAVGLVFKKEKWTYGVFSQNLFSFGDIATTQLQPILAYTLNRKISFALGDLQHTYDWKKDRFVNVPLGFQVNYIANLGEQPVRLFINPQYNLKNEFGARKWTITSGFALIVK